MTTQAFSTNSLLHLSVTATFLDRPAVVTAVANISGEVQVTRGDLIRLVHDITAVTRAAEEHNARLKAS